MLWIKKRAFGAHSPKNPALQLSMSSNAPRAGHEGLLNQTMIWVESSFEAKIQVRVRSWW